MNERVHAATNPRTNGRIDPADRRDRLRDARLYLCTDGRGGGDALDAFLDAVLGAGVDVVQLREKTMEAREQLALAERFRAACDRHGALFVFNDRVDLALAAGADGVHLGQDDLPPERARALAGDELLIGRSTHSAADIEKANAEPVDYVAVGPVFETPTKPGRSATGVALVEAAARAAAHPWFAIGGLGETNLRTVIEKGATRIVLVRAITLADDPALAVKRLRTALDAV
jgi:thiamine-phosphate pyrophosphorylase